MSLEQVKTVVENFICDTHGELLVIKGKWGAGKTFFWRQMIEENRKQKRVGRKYYAYVSLFGVNSLEELKIAIFASLVEANASDVAKGIEKLAEKIKPIVKRLESVPALNRYTGGLIGETLFHSLDNALICIDDLERKGKGLDIKDIFGLVDVLKDQRGCKVVLIMNEAGLDDISAQDEFKKHGEKIIDREVGFAPTPEESFGYIFGVSEHHYELIKRCCLRLPVKNLRIVQRIKRFIGDITPYLRGIENKIAEDTISSLILYVWCYYNKEGNTPPLDYVLNYSSVRKYISKTYKKEVDPEKDKWDDLITAYGYFHTDEVDRCLAEFIERGYIDKPKFEEELKQKNENFRNEKRGESYRAVWNLIHTSFEDNEDEFISNLTDAFHLNISIFSVGDLDTTVDALRFFKRDEQADNLVDEYFNSRNAERDLEQFRLLKRTSSFGRLKDDYLLSRLNTIIRTKNSDARPLADVIKKNVGRDDWDWDDLRRLNSFTSDDFYEFFKTEHSDDLRHYILVCLRTQEIEDNEIRRSKLRSIKRG